MVTSGPMAESNIPHRPGKTEISLLERVRREDRLSSKGQGVLRTNLAQTCGILLVLLVAGFVVTTLQVYGHAGAALLWALAFLTVGSIGGFLFAIPRVPRSSLQRKAASMTEGGPASKLRRLDERGFGLGINTNLEEISDWLTKILVGVGLIELRSLPENIRRIGNYVGQGLGPDQQTVAAAIVIYFFGLGFLCGYLLTRMFLGPAFRLADQATTVGFEEKLEETRALAIAAQTASQAVVETTEINADVETAIEELKKTERPPARMDQLIDRLEAHRRLSPLHRKLNIVLGRVYREGKDDLDSAIRVLDDFLNAKAQANQTSDRDTSDAYFNMACYYSQKMERATGEIRNQFEDKGVRALEKSLAILPENVRDVNVDKDLTELRKSQRVIELMRTVSDTLTQSN